MLGLKTLILYVFVAVSDDQNISLVEIKFLTKGDGEQDWKDLAESSVCISNNCFENQN